MVDVGRVTQSLAIDHTLDFCSQLHIVINEINHSTKPFFLFVYLFIYSEMMDLKIALAEKQRVPPTHKVASKINIL